MPVARRTYSHYCCPMSISAPFRITVAALTRQRPAMLAALVRSWGEMDIPEGCEVRCLVVENDTVPCSESVVQEAGSMPNGVALDYVLETELGIPFGRNRAAKEAIANGSDILAFVDDDETVAQDWLVRLTEGFRASGAMLAGAPLRAAPVHEGASLVQRLMHANIANRYLRKENRAARKASLQDSGPVTTVTNNWMADLRLFTEHGLWFDEAMRMTGGTDAKFHAETRAKGLPVGWVKDAFVYEEIPQQRLSFWYQALRARDQVNTNLRRKFDESFGTGLARMMALPLKALLLVGLLLVLPFQPQQRLMDVARTLGWVLGALGILVGYRSELYHKVTGT
ncbi:glycosyltransferase [Leisingera aquaemixtae]|uniref:glycosyltransferase n=1 Tax=Leisingera aquaemixtae TaxID=1396826 RepID=UPI0028F6DE8E|nr:glycosyltransferase [Leisingera aquaemixtae]